MDDTGTDDGTNVLSIGGTPRNDTFIMRPGSVAMVNYTAQRATGEIGVREMVYYTQRINGGVTVNGYEGNDVFVCDGTSATMTLNGWEGDDTFIVGQLLGSKRNDSNTLEMYHTVVTPHGWLSDGCNYPLTANGGIGKDTFTVQHNLGTVDLNGDEGKFFLPM